MATSPKPHIVAAHMVFAAAVVFGVIYAVVDVFAFYVGVSLLKFTIVREKKGGMGGLAV